MEKIFKLFELLKGLFKDRFYGKVEINFEAGNITNCKKEESIKL